MASAGGGKGEDEKPVRKIIIKRVSGEGHAGHHGGAWKVAYADFVTAMMAFFLLMWLLAITSIEEKQKLAEYFNTPVFDSTGDGIMQNVMPMSKPTIAPQQPALSPGEQEAEDAMQAETYAKMEKAQFEHVGQALNEEMDSDPELQKLKDNLIVDEIPEGLRLQIIDREPYSMFPSGSAEMDPRARTFLAVIAKTLKPLRKKISIRGHTDSRPYAQGSKYDNWKLSSDRANATRAAMVETGINPALIESVVGLADVDPLVKDNPADSRNRRISIILYHRNKGIREKPAEQ